MKSLIILTQVIFATLLLSPTVSGLEPDKKLNTTANTTKYAAAGNGTGEAGGFQLKGKPINESELINCGEISNWKLTMYKDDKCKYQGSKLMHADHIAEYEYHHTQNLKEIYDNKEKCMQNGRGGEMYACNKKGLVLLKFNDIFCREFKKREYFYEYGECKQEKNRLNMKKNQWLKFTNAIGIKVGLSALLMASGFIFN